jgi:GcrA cell cycle regulator
MLKGETQSTWTDERVDHLRRLINAGFTCAQIAAEIGVSRNSVIGKANRMRLSRFASREDGTVVETCKPRARRVFRPASLGAVTSPPNRELESLIVRIDTTIEAGMCALQELEQWQCRWPFDDPASPHHKFCGRRQIDSLPYCAAHARLAYRPVARSHRANYATRGERP